MVLNRRICFLNKSQKHGSQAFRCCLWEGQVQSYEDKNGQIGLPLSLAVKICTVVREMEQGHQEHEISNESQCAYSP